MMNPTYVIRQQWGAMGLTIALAIILASGLHPAQARPWTFAVVGDTRGNNDSPGVNTQIVHKIALDIAGTACRFVLVPGDLIQGGGSNIPAQYDAWKNALAPIYQAGIAIYPVRGNHECGQDPTGAVWRTTFPHLPTNGPAGEVGLTYSFAFSNAFCIALDQYVRRHRINQAWLTAQFKRNTRPHIFVYGHEPAFRVMHSDCLAVHAAERDIFWASLRRAGGRIYFCGHDHLYNRAAVVEGRRPVVFQIVTGTGGAPLRTWKGQYFDPRVKLQYGNTTLFGYNLVTVENERTVTVEWRALLPGERWKVLDALTVTQPVRALPQP